MSLVGDINHPITVWLVPTNEHIYLYTFTYIYWLILTQYGLISGFSLCIIPFFEAEPKDASASCWWTATATVWSTSAKRGRSCRRTAGRCKPPSLPRQAPRLGERWWKLMEVTLLVRAIATAVAKNLWLDRLIRCDHWLVLRSFGHMMSCMSK